MNYSNAFGFRYRTLSNPVGLADGGFVHILALW
jgi:hypothetical protein